MTIQKSLLVLIILLGLQTKAQTPLSATSLKLTGTNPIASTKGFRNQIDLSGSSSGIVYNSGLPSELMFGFHSNGNFYWGTGRSATKPDFYPMYLKADTGDLYLGGKLGIGTTSPQAALDVKVARANFKTYDYGAEITHSINEPWARSFRIRNEAQNSNIAFGGYNGTAYISTGFDINTDKAGHLTQKLTILPDGNVGIGTNTPTAKLHVSNGINSYGAILATSDQPFHLYSRTFLTTANTEVFRFGMKYQENFNDNSYISFYRGNSANDGSLGVSTGGAERLRISYAGRVGIGTTNPSSILHIDSPNEAAVTIATQSKSLRSKILLKGPRAAVGMFSTHEITTEGEEHFDMGIYADENLYLGTNGMKHFAIRTNGYIGIGTTTAESKLTIEPGASVSTKISGKDIHLGVLVKTTSGRSGYTVLNTNNYLNNAGNNAHFSSLFPFDDIVDRNNDLTWKAFRLQTGTGLVDKFWINKLGQGYYAGSVGIGSDPTSKYMLAVGGTITAQEVVIQLKKADGTWPDYVFEKEYKLPTLTEVENHIKEKGHLKNIPSANEISNEGVHLGKINAQLLEKIEELTLYTIQQEKQIKSQEERLSKLEALLLEE